MCGIAGIATTGRAGDVHFPFEAMNHRGPDDRGTETWSGTSSSWQLAHTRLSIVDLSSSGRQPMASEDGSLVMVFNGEIYNSPELRRFCEAKGHRFCSAMDGEVILHLWEMEGPACLNRLNGIFAVAVASARTGELVLARDPVGVKPLVYVLAPDGALWFASEAAILRAAGAPIGGHDVVALAQFLTFMWVPDPRTPYVGVQSLEPGHAVRWKQGGVENFAYGDPLVPASEPADMSFTTALGEVGERLVEATRRQLLADVPIALMASGGVDSGLVWWAAAGELAGAYTVAWADEDGIEHLGDDRRAVVELAERYRTDVRYLAGENADRRLAPSGLLFADPSFNLTRLIAQAAHDDGCKVLLAGLGGDELFAGYRRHQIAPYLARLRLGSVGRLAERRLTGLVSRLGVEYAARLARATSEKTPLDAYMVLCSYSTAHERARVLDCTEAEVADAIVWQRHREVFESLPAELSFLRRVMALDLAVYLPGLALAQADLGAMEFGVEIRVPWLDLDFVRWTLALPESILTRWTRGKLLTRQLAARKLSPWIAHRPKRAFAAPAASIGPSAGERGFRQGSFFARACRQLESHMAITP